MPFPLARFPARALWPAIAILAAGATELRAFDMRECQVDALTFVNSWSSETFEVERVGTSFYYLCGEAQAITRDPADPSLCRGPYGSLLLDGQHNSGKRYTAIYELHSSGAPCCGWSIFPEDAHREMPEKVTWLKPRTAPRLRDWPIDAIHNDWGPQTALDGMTALVCGMNLS